MPEEYARQFDKSVIFNLKVIRRGIFLFTGITILTFAAIFLYTNGAKNLSVWREMDWRYLAIGLVFVVVDLFIGGLRNHIFIREFVPGISQMVSIKANMANIFMGAITPSQSGGGPAQWYIFYRHGVSIPDMLSTSFYNWISTIIFFPISGAFAIYILSDKVPEGFVMHLTKFAFSVFTTLFVAIFLAYFLPNVFKYLVKTISQIVELIKKSWGQTLEGLGNKSVEKLTEYKIKYLGLMKNKPHVLLYSFLLTVVLYFNKYALAYIFCVAFAVEVDMWSIIAVMAVSYMLLYFAPSPGGSGIAEISITALLVPFIGEELAPLITLLHRSFLVFLPVLLGAMVVLKQISKEK